MTKTNETGWKEEFDAEFKRDDDPSSIFPSRLSDVKAFIEREIAAAREQAIKEAVACVKAIQVVPHHNASEEATRDCPECEKDLEYNQGVIDAWRTIARLSTSDKGDIKEI